MSVQIPSRLYGILGNPLGHSLSPALHNFAFRLLGHDGVYMAWQKNTDALDAFFAAVRSLPIAGLSVTIPHKQAVIPFLDGVTERAGLAGAVNTVFRANGALLGDNTDVAGFLAPLRARTALPARALILGAGGVCRAALSGLQALGVQTVTVAARDPEKARPLAEEFGCLVASWNERATIALAQAPLLLINATPLGMSGGSLNDSPVPDGFWRALAATGSAADNLAYDLIYSPPRTLFLAHAAEAGVPTQDGLDFFIAQAMEQLNLWTGSQVPDTIRTECRRLVERLLPQRQVSPSS